MRREGIDYNNPSLLPITWWDKSYAIEFVEDLYDDFFDEARRKKFEIEELNRIYNVGSQRWKKPILTFIKKAYGNLKSKVEWIL